ncbi:2-dehydro-3-deoxy-6-phosphogalactonate aldolase [Ruania halotolerans]|uniref:2-dehydro-3-deoxy-6-phosphogalactonate aldolase n=1 Tax=Ruania halotolerans TaxID=2897773 RepID=UPI001E504BAA|nr:2-dehydro-3-deoxy-6-phosphogalactonate aldolase [Ruania halotolerans]UFU06739.1 2-dehydro-3-deoxy-6-phosphogalactonate aldolase [Ruania halotolerans]
MTGLIAILRGLTPADAADVGAVLYESGFRTLEVPLNSPDPLRSIQVLRESLPADAQVGAGTVLTTAQVTSVLEAGGQLVVSPNTDVDVIEATVAAGLASYPGVATVSEAFTAIRAGARALKLFPAQQVGLSGMQAWLAVLPPVHLIPVGGVGADQMAGWVDAGATGFGIGSSLYTPGVALAELGERARGLVEAWSSARPRLRTVTTV